MFKSCARQLIFQYGRQCRRPAATQRLYSTATEPSRAPLQLVAELRKRTDTSISKAREALLATNNNVDAALEWLQKDLAQTGAKKAAKVEGREMKEGLIGISVLASGYGEGAGGVRAAMVELNCETDFVGRNELYGKLASDIAHTVAFHAEAPSDFEENPSLLRQYSIDLLLDTPLMPKILSLGSPEKGTSVGSAIRDSIAKLGENLGLRRAVSVVLPSPPEAIQAGLRVAPYVHGSTLDPWLGRIGTLALVYIKSPRLKELYADEKFREAFGKVERALARQIVGFETNSIRLVGSSPETALYEQPFSLLPGEFNGKPVKNVLEEWATQKGLIDSSKADEYQGIAVSEFARWSVGQDLSSSNIVSSKHSSP